MEETQVLEPETEIVNTQPKRERRDPLFVTSSARPPSPFEYVNHRSERGGWERCGGGWRRKPAPRVN